MSSSSSSGSAGDVGKFHHFRGPSLLAIALLGFWSAVIYVNRPAACCASAEVDVDGDDLERLQYDFLKLRDVAACEPYADLVTAKLLLGEGRPDPALIRLESVAANESTKVRALNLTGEALYRLGKLMDAGTVWSSVLQRDPDNVVAIRWLGIAYNDLGAAQEAIQYLARAAKLAPTDAGPHRLSGLIWKQMGKYSEALDAFQESLRRKPQQVDAKEVRYETAECLHYLNRDNEALEVLAGFEPSADVLSLRARCEHACGHAEKAWEMAEQALQLDNRQTWAWLLEAQIASEQKRPTDAIACWRRVAEIEPCNREAHYQLAIAYKRLGQAEEAEQERLAAEELSQLQDEQQRLAEVAATSPNDLEARIKLGTLCERLQRYRAAREWFRAAVYLDPQNQPAREALVRLLKMNDPAAAGVAEPNEPQIQ